MFRYTHIKNKDQVKEMIVNKLSVRVDLQQSLRHYLKGTMNVDALLYYMKILELDKWVLSKLTKKQRNQCFELL